MEEMFKDTLDQQPMARLLSASADVTSSREPIAIIGMGCRFPGANSPEDFWRLLCNEVDAITEVPADRFPIDAFYDPRPGLVGKMVTRWGGFLNGVDQFDASFFGISSHAASRMDPQYRLLLEVAWEALEDAGLTREQLVGSRTGVFIGMTTGDYQDLQCRNTEDIDVYVVTGGLRSVASGRISYAFDLQGPSIVVDTACTSSLTALHLACQSLRAGECSMALVGGSHLILQPELTLGFSAAGMMSPDGHCKFGDANANGYVRSEGVGVLVLKPLSQALADGDPIQALIRGSATNNDGRSGKSLVTPGYDAQIAVLREAYRDAKLLPSQVHYLEAHGTGTSVGDAVEIRALATVLTEGRAPDRPCHIGSVKTNIGHTEGAAGMASLVKAILCLKHRALPKSLHCKNLNPVLPWSEVPLVIQQTFEPFPAQDEPILVGVSAFGVSGTNAHIVLEEAKQSTPDITRNEASNRALLLPLSAHTSEALTALARSYQAFAPEYAFADVCYTAGVRRTHHAHRLALVVHSYEELHAQLENFLQGRADPNVTFGSVRSDLPQQCFDQRDQIETALPALHHGEDEYTAQLRSLALLYTLGCPISWSKLYPAASRCVSLPSYPWQHEHFWMKTDARGAYNWPPVSERQRDVSSHPLLGHHWTSAVHGATHFWDVLLSTDLFPYLNDHHVQGAVVLPASAYAEIVLAAAREVFHIVPVLKDITFKKAIFLSDMKEKHVQLVLTLEHPGMATFQFFCQEDSDGTGQNTWTLHASGMAVTDLSAIQLDAFESETPEQIQARCQQVYTGQKYYQSLALRGFRYGPCFQAIAEIARRDGEALARIQLVEQVVADSGAYLVHPALLDGCFQAILAALPEDMSKTATYVLVRLKSLQISDRLVSVPSSGSRKDTDSRRLSTGKIYTPNPNESSGNVLWSHAVLRSGGDDKTDIIEGDLSLIDEQGRVASASLELIGKQIEDVKEENHLRDWLYEWHWEARPWSQIDRSSQKLPQGPWLIFADRLGIGEQLSRLLTVSGRDCVLAFRGTSYQQLTPQRYLLQPGSLQDFQQLLRDASSASGPFCGIIHLWSIDAHPAIVKTSASIEEAQQTGVLSIMNLVQAMASLGGDKSPLLWLVTCGAQPVPQSNDVFSVEQAPVSGLGRVLVNEHPELQCRRIDLERADVSTQAQLLFWELQVGDREDEVALSKEARLVHRLVRCETDVVTNKPSLFRPDATYLIAGGLGGLGLTVADWMVRQGARYLVLVGRSGASSEAEQVITTLQEMGAQVVIAKADISEEQEVADLLTTMQTSLPPLRGLIHAAAVLDDGVLLRQDAQRFHKVIAPKIKGAWNLHTLTAHLQLDFFVLFSSAATLLGLPGQSNYVAANEFLDVLAHYRRRLGLSALSINWGTWSEVGMAASRTGASPVPTSERLALRGMSSLTPQQGLDALTYLLSQDRPQVAVMSVDWPQWHLFYPEFADSPLLAHLMAQSRAMTHAIVQAAQETLQTPILATQPEDRLELVTHYLDGQISQALGLGAEKSNRDLPLIEQGLDSLMAVELKNKIQAGLGVSVTMTKLLESASTIQLAQDIFEQLQTAFTHQLADKFGKNNEQPKVVQLDPKLVFAKKPSLATIKKRKETLPLSSAQQRLWFLDKMFPGSTNYNVPVIVRLTGSLNIQALQQSLQEIIQRHEVLRTTFEAANGQPVQVISSDASLSLLLVDLCACQLEKREQTAMQLASEEAQQRPFDLERGPLFRAQLLYLGPSQYWLLITVHHIVFDVWSLGVMLRELSALYTSRVQRQPSLLADLPLQYGDYTLWQHKQMRGKLLDDQLAYWKEHLAGAPLVLELPTDHPRPAVQSYRGTRFFFRFPPALMERVADLSRREGVTLFMTMLAAWQIVLGHTSQQEDFLVGSPIAGRQRLELEKLIGFLVNTLVLRAQLAGHMTFRELLKRVKKTTLAAYEHQDVPFEQLVEMLHPPRDLSRSPVFQVLFILQNMPLPPLELSGLSATASEGPCTTSRFDIYINLWEKADFDHWIEYPTDLFEEGTIARMVEHYQRVLEQVVVDADLPISRITLLTEHERQQVISGWNATQIDYSRPGWIHQWISEQAQRTPNAPALFFEQEVMTYRQLEQRSNQLGHYLQRLGVEPEQRVGIYLERSFTLVLALLGVLKAGGAYIPLDTSYPHERLEYMLKDGQVSVLLTQASLHGRFSGFEGHEVVLNETWDVISQESEAIVRSQVSGQNLAYVIYTSGSTGRPKGVMNTHEGLINCLDWMQDTFGLTTADRVLQQTPTSFDVSVWEIFWPLTSGAGLVLARPGGQQDPRYIQDLIVSRAITTVHFVPSMLQNYLQMQENYPIPEHRLQRIICIGEALSSATVARNQQQWAVPVFNLYGPTEATIQVTWWLCSLQGEGQQTVPIGHPIANTQIYLLDKYGEPVPVGVVGELYIGGVQVARGYLHRPDLTAERFVPNPFVGTAACPCPELGGRLYKTGDLARYRADGVIEYLGRIDQQVKLRGFRIELGEIEALLHTHQGVRDAVIATYGDDPINKKLVAYVILEDSTGGGGQAQDAVPTTTQLQDWLRKEVPEHMVPPVFMYLDAFPLTANGKLDRRSLPRPTSQYLEGQRTPVPPRTVTEHQLTKIFADILSLETVGVEDSLFDLGFHSLLVTRAAARIRETLQVDVPPPLFFEHWTIERLAQYLQTTYAAAPDLDSATTEMMTGEEFTLGAVTADKILPIEASPVVPQQHSRLDHVSEQKAHTGTETIAIIGMSGAFPQAPDVQSLWNNLLAGRDCIGEIPVSRWDWQAYPNDPTHSERMNVKWAGVMEDVEAFDPQFFGISPHEAELMDPQQRFLMMYVWKAIEDAGYSAESISGTDTALFVGTASTGYSERASRHMGVEGYSATGLVPSVGPGRMSYFLNLHGPSEPVETACSSSLVAIHRGVNAIESGQCSMAIVGGVNILASPEAHISFCKAGMISSDGRCKAFSAQANGYVRGEGVGMLVLKKLVLAEQAGDHIYGVIRSSAENHGGRTSSLTAPNPQAQADLLITAYRKAGIDPCTVGYIEAHGTGTELGDPIEINGLKSAWSKLSETIGEGPIPEGVCGIGSVKSNIGHLELAAGVAGVIKVLLQMQHKQLVKSLHCEQLNPYIELKGSPFSIVQENREWEALRDQAGNILPRRAGVSSFGFGGVNAHVVLEEYVPKGTSDRKGRDGVNPSSTPRDFECSGSSTYRSVDEGLAPSRPLRSPAPPLLIVLSARNEERLYEQTQQLLAWVETETRRGAVGVGIASVQRLQDLAYTLQVGRSSMEERLAFQVNSFAELEEKLRSYLQDPQAKGNWYRGQTKRYNEMVALLGDDEELQEAIDKWFQRGKYEKLLSLWANGGTLDWKRLYTVGMGSELRPTIGASPMATALPRRMSLPTYPFAQERYWIPASTSSTATCGNLPVAPRTQTLSFAALHPLVQRNISDLFAQRFSSTFHGDEFFLADHVVKGQRMMPGVAYLEMARAAVAQAVRSTVPQERRILRLSHVVWARPLVVSSHPVTVHITLSPEDSRTISFVISRDEAGQEQTSRDERIANQQPLYVPMASQEEETSELVYCQGTAELYVEEEVAQSLDLTAIQARCQRSYLSATTWYRLCREHSINYGSAFQGIEHLQIGEGEALARLRLPVFPVRMPEEPHTQATVPEAHTRTDFVLHPGVLDSALQACIGLLIEQNAYQETLVPFALDELSIVSEAPQGQPMVPVRGWAWVRYRQNSMRMGAGGTETRTSPIPASTFDIEVCDDEGHVALRLRGFSTRMLREDTASRQDTRTEVAQMSFEGNRSTPSASTLEEGHRKGPSEHLHSYIPHWNQIVLPKSVAEGNSTSPVVIIGGTPDEQRAIGDVYPSARTLEIPTSASIEQIALRLQELGTIKRLFWLAPHHPGLKLSQESILAAKPQGVLQSFRLIKALLLLGYASQTLDFMVIIRQARTLHATETVHPTHAGLLGLFGSLGKEIPHWSIQLVDLPIAVPLPLAEMQRLPADPQGYGWLYRNGNWYRQTLVPLHTSSLDTGEAYRKGGVYVVIGGAGGIGTAWSEYVIRRYQAQTIWIGRRKADAEILASQERLAALGPRPHYITADATDLSALHQAYQEIKRNYGQIHGVIHSAIVLKDQSLANMDEERFQAALAAKVDVCVQLAQVFEHEPLDFVLFFSSLNAIVSNAGQSNYAAGSTFEDAFAARLGQEWHSRVKVMNWGYWGSIGVVASLQYRERMAQMGVGSIEPAEAMEALEYLLAGPVDQMVLLKMTQTVGMEAVPTSDPTGRNAHPDVQREPLDAETRQGIQEMEELLCKFLWSHLQSLGLFREKHAVLSLLREQAGISTNYDRWLQESITLLERQQYLHCEGAPVCDGRSTCTVQDPTLIESASLWQYWDQYKEHWMQNAHLKAQVVLAEMMLRALPSILTGKRPATEIMFPDGSVQVVGEFYQHHVTADPFNAVLARLVVTYLQERLAGGRHARIRILEIGAGTGGTASRVLQMLQPYQAYIAEYCYSDISEAFLRYGQQTYGVENPFLTYRLLNVEKPLTEQGIKLGSYDVVIASNVLHATRNIRRTVRNAKAALKKHGLLLLNEITDTNLFMHLTFGLLSGWWLYEDPELRVPGSPALTIENWKAVLSSEGFEEISLPTQDMPELGQQVIMAVAKDIQVTVSPRAVPTSRSIHPNEASAMSKPHTIPATNNTDEVLREKSATYLKKQVGKVLNLPITKIDADEPLINYGLDSILVLQLTSALRIGMKEISSTLFFEYPTIDALVEYFLKTQKETLEHLAGASVPTHESLQPGSVSDSPLPLRDNPKYLPMGATGTPLRFLAEERTSSKKDEEEDTGGTGQEPYKVPAASIRREAPVPQSGGRDIAIVGLTGRYPEAKDIQAFWDLLKAGKSGIREIPPDRWDWRHYFQATKGITNGTGTPAMQGTGSEPRTSPTMSTKWGGFLEDIECFDASFFHISPYEAEQMDPQERLFLEVSYACIEDAGYTPAQLQEDGPVGVFVGVMNSNYSTGVRYWSIANRVSFVLGLQGPSLAVDTACSSSLTALHLAVESLISGTSAAAIAGGVNLIVDPMHYARLSQLGMLSASDQCKSFGENADGFVDGEGVGAVLLKPLQRAEADGDHIYGVIKATAINHGGKTNGYTVPNPQMQAKVIEQALQRGTIDPRTISYIEAHGTGTVLGDPIEIAGLARAFEACGATDNVASGREQAPTLQAPGWCAIGSVKSNIGHTESAAGISGVTKVLLQMHYGQLVPSLHAQVLNPHIDFSATPFVVQQELSEWKRGQSGEGAALLPRRAGVSSFGAGGSNVHVILEEYIEKHQDRSHRVCLNGDITGVGVGSAHDTGQGQALSVPIATTQRSRPALVVLSARTQEQLHKQVQQLLDWIQAGRCTEEGLLDLVYTLQVGREAMKERLALPVSSLAELEEKLHKYLQNPNGSKDWYIGYVNNKDIIADFMKDEDGQKAIEAWMSKEKYGKLLAFWVRGLTIDWKRLYTVGAGLASARPRRISLPTYPFARERHWITTSTVGAAACPCPSTATTVFPPAALHPLVQRNTSTLWEQQFHSTFHGDEFFLADHVIRGQRIMPAVAYLEMVVTAVREAIGDNMMLESSQLHLSNVVWLRPLIVSSHPVTVHIALEAQENGVILFVIRREREGEEAEEHIYCQGSALVELVGAGLAPAHERQTPVRSLDLPALQSRCQRQILASECYQRYRELGITYGPAFQAIEQLRGGEGEAIARFRLPSVVAQTQTEGGYVLHPSVLDAALHASIGLFRERDRQLQVPFALSDLSIVGEVKASGWARVAWRQGSTEESLLDIEVCDDEGRVAVRMSGLSTRAFLAGSSESLRTALLTPDWKEETLVSSLSSEETAMHPPSLIVLCDLPESLASRIQAELAVVGHCRSLSIGMPTGASSASQAQLQRAQRFQEALVQLIQELQRLWSKPKGTTTTPAVPFLVQVVVAHREEPSFFEALIGVLKTAQQEEYPKLQGQLIEVDGELEEEELLALLRENQYRPQESHIRYQNDKRWMRAWQEIPVHATPARIPWKEGGCYLITGGAGGLARLFVQEIARQVQDATIILVGRSALSTEQRAQLVDCGRKPAPTLQASQTETGGIDVDYQQVDVSNGPAVHALVQKILQRYEHLDGIIHAAGVLRDSLLLNKTQEDVQAVLAPKVVGVEHLDEASSQIPLDFFVLCSSLAAVVGNVGQADYASANAYLDAFAYARAAKVRAGERQGVTVSINWPFWGEGGMRIEAEQIQMIQAQTGMEAMGTETGMKVLYQALACGQAQVLVVHGQVERIKQRVLGQASDLPVGSGQVQAGRDESQPLQVSIDGLREALTHRVSDLLKVQVEQIDAETALTEYGFDSITFTRFANHLNQTYQLDLAPPVFFEYSTIESLARYLRATYTSVLAPHFTTGSPLATDVAQKNFVSEAPRATKQVAPVRQRPRATRWLMSIEDSKATAAATPIAIIGMSGAFPQAPDVQSLWSNLLEGRDCIGAIPQDRWQTYFGRLASGADKADIKWAGILAGIELFDPLFFGISSREAELMDPQQRLLMMHVWKAIEDAGYDASSLSGTNTALFIGTGSSGYGEQAFHANVEVGGYSSTGLAPSMGPGRISYFLNLHGPSEAIDTACSSSLVAIHRGVNAIESGQCTVAIVGGVNTLLSPEEHISFSKAGMLSSDGRCKTFSAQANGYVRGEGIGMLVLKKLSEAEQAGDHIYGVIRSSAENHGGRASSLTAPNPRAQADLLVAAYRKAGIDPRTVSYIEAHGTGTPLGDPIEINGLKAAFGELMTDPTENKNAWCGIGSVKSNIGHLERAAGVVGVIKVLLQMQHKQLVKSLHCMQINPYIQLEGSPFYIVQENREWEALRDQMGNPLPRRVGVSSFGFSGANAHVVLEEYVPKLRTPHLQSQPQPPALIVLSARTRERLKEQVQQLLLWIQGEEAGLLSAKEPVRLDNLAYTLQVGREAMEERLAIQVSSLTDLVEKLRKYLQDPQEAVAWYRGQVRPHKEVVELFSTEKELQAITERWLQQGQYDRILQWWVKGLKISWHLLYTVGAGQAQGAVPTAPARPHRISLPTYPFARERYWIPMGVGPMATPPVGAHQTKWDRAGDHKGTLLRDGWHPLVQHNTSTLWEQQFSSTFYGDEFFLADHVVKGQRILPAVAYLEMARAAVREAIGDGEMLEPSQVRLSNIVWMRPLIVSSQPVTVRIALEAQENGTISFVVKGEKQGEEAEEHIYCQGRALVELVGAGLAPAHERQTPIQSLDLATLQSRCQRQVPVSEYYQRYRELGITYGPAMQAIEQLSVGEGVVLARLRLPVGVVLCAAPGLVPGEAQTRTEEGRRDRACPCPLPYVLHPSMLDAALQASLGLVIGQPGMQELSLPFALSDLSIMGEVKASGWAWVTRRRGHAGESVLDIEVCDDEGRVVVHMRGLSTRAFLSRNSESLRASLRIPDWKEETLVSSLPSLDHIPFREIRRTDESLRSSQSLQIPIDELREALTHMVSDLLKVQVKQIDAETELTEYGFDSITFMALANRLNLTYQLDLAPSLFFEHSTLESLARYLQTTYASVLAPHFATGSSAAPRLALEGTHKELLPDKMPPIGTSPMTTVPRRRSRVARSLLQVSEGEISEMFLAASHTRQAGHEAIEERLALLEKEEQKTTLHRTDTYSVILAPNPSLLTGAGTNTIVLGDQRTGAVVIDPATDDPAYLSEIIQEGQRYGGIRRILISHWHFDHIGGAEALRAQLGVPILAFSNKKVPFADEEIADNTLFPIGDDMLRALYTPGHCSDHLCFWLEKQRILFASDLVMSSGPSFVFPPPDGDLQEYMHSLERVQHLECVKIIPAHGETILRPKELLAECLARCQQRKQQILAVVRHAPQGIDIKTIVQALYRNVDTSLYDFMSTSILLNLSLLEREGQVKHIENKQSEQKDYWIFTGERQ